MQHLTRKTKIALIAAIQVLHDKKSYKNLHDNKEITEPTIELSDNEISEILTETKSIMITLGWTPQKEYKMYRQDAKEYLEDLKASLKKDPKEFFLKLGEFSKLAKDLSL